MDLQPQRRRPWELGAVGALLLTASACSPRADGVAAGPLPARAAPPADRSAPRCGGDPLPPCPLQEWMDSTLATQVRRADTAALARSLHALAGYEPAALRGRPEGWAAIARRGGEAARRGDLTGARESCRDCHRLYRDEYRRRLRERPLPPSEGQGDAE